jgi:hypothetical protein
MHAGQMRRIAKFMIELQSIMMETQISVQSREGLSLKLNDGERLLYEVDYSYDYINITAKPLLKEEK